jgi:hypothetical protein
VKGRGGRAPVQTIQSEHGNARFNGVYVYCFQLISFHVYSAPFHTSGSRERGK